MPITTDATKGWALPASAAEWTTLLATTGIANPDSAWRLNQGAGNASDLIGSLTLTANGTPNYVVAATGWTATGVSVPDNGTHGFNVIAAAGPDPATTSQVWMFIVSIEVEPTAARNFIGVNSGAAAIATTFQPAAGVNKLRVTCVGVSITGTADHGVGSYVFTLRYDRAVSAAKAYSDLETVSTTYSGATTDGKKGFSFGGASPGSIVLLYAALWTGANAETLDDTKIGTIRSKIESPPGAGGGGAASGYYRHLLRMGGL